MELKKEFTIYFKSTKKESIKTIKMQMSFSLFSVHTKNWNCGFYLNTNIQWWLQKPNFIPGNDKLWERISQTVSVFKQ